MQYPELYFPPDLYHASRPGYPAVLFSKIKSAWFRNQPLSAPQQLQVLDLGAGTGLAYQSFQKFWGPCIADAQDRSQDMKSFVTRTEPNAYRTYETEGQRDELSVMNRLGSYDLFLAASSFHWMPEEFVTRILDQSKPAALFWIGEYQFPWAVENDTWNSYLKTAFNQRWRFESQIPRGNFWEVTASVRSHSAWRLHSREEVTTLTYFSFEDFFSHLRSQARFQAGVRTLEKCAQEKAILRDLWPKDRDYQCFRFIYSSHLYEKRR